MENGSGSYVFWKSWLMSSVIHQGNKSGEWVSVGKKGTRPVGFGLYLFCSRWWREGQQI